MKQEQLVALIDGSLRPLGFRKKRNTWLKDGDEVAKVVNLQRSRFANRFYVNYGLILKSIPLEGDMMHVFNGLGSLDADENSRIHDLMNLESDISDVDRTAELNQILASKLVPYMRRLNTEGDVLASLKDRPTLNDVPLIVKRHFGLLE
jgi:Domain of unknown function (DUF4304)